eukprot:m.453637 g.453637  ORF g.453637 m.453637 type:complete len:55 (+) comp21552_c0_seq2:1842-2006(+)
MHSPFVTHFPAPQDKFVAETREFQSRAHKLWTQREAPTTAPIQPSTLARHGNSA